VTSVNCRLQSIVKPLKPLIKATMSDYGSVESIKQKIRQCVYRTFVKDHTKNELWKYFEGVSATEDGEETKLPYVRCTRCSGLLKYNSKSSGTSHLRRHADGCQSKSGAATSNVAIGSFF